MPLTPLDIHNKEFKRSFRGYDVDEVNDFLDQIIKDFEFLIREKQQLEQQVEELQQELDRVMEEQSMSPMQSHTPMPQQQSIYQPPEPAPQAQVPASTINTLTSMEQSIHKSIRVAQEVADEVRLNAKKEAELIVQEAEKNADRIINEALQKARAIHSELLDLKQKSTIYRARFRTLVQSHMDILENSDWESLEELEEGLEEKEKQFDAYTMSGPEPLEDSNPSHHFSNFHDHDYQSHLEDADHSYLEEEEEPRRELRRTARKLKKKAMF